MIKLKNNTEIAHMRTAGAIASGARALACSLVAAGVTTKHIDTKVREYIEKHGATPSFLGYGGFPASVCISLNEEVIHGIPSERQIHEGDLVKIDIGACYKGYHGDCADSVLCGAGTAEIHRLIKAARDSFHAGIAMACPGNRIGDISAAVQAVIESQGFSAVRKFIGHGIGSALHEDPEVPNFGFAGKGARLYAGMTIAVEPMVNAGTYNVRTLSDDWTVVTADSKLSAHYENTILITDNGPEILTFSA